MGYTHYWTIKSPPKGQAAQVEELYQRTILECQRVVVAFYKEYGGLSGYTAHTKPGSYGGLLVNGKGVQGHEEFCFREHYKQNVSDFTFCKTAGKHYDDCVVACLAVLKYRLKGLIDVSSDGEREDWVKGTEFARKVLRRKVPNPIPSTYYSK